MMNKLDTVDHIAIEVQDIAESISWYTEQFNCEILYQDETWGFIKFNNIKLALVLPSQHPPHIAFKRDDAGAYGQLKMHRDGTKSVYIKDPNGNSIEIMKSE